MILRGMDRAWSVIETILLLILLAAAVLVALSAGVTLTSGMVAHPTAARDTGATIAIAVAMLVFSLPLIFLALQALGFHLKSDRRGNGTATPDRPRRGGPPWERGWQP